MPKMRAVRVAHAHWESFCRGEGEQGCILASPPERPESRLQSYRGTHEIVRSHRDIALLIRGRS